MDAEQLLDLLTKAKAKGSGQNNPIFVQIPNRNVSLVVQDANVYFDKDEGWWVLTIKTEEQSF